MKQQHSCTLTYKNASERLVCASIRSAPGGVYKFHGRFSGGPTKIQLDRAHHFLYTEQTLSLLQTITSMEDTE